MSRLKRITLHFSRDPTKKATSKQGKKIKLLQNNVALFGQLYISMQNRQGDLKEFFAHEVRSFPPSLSDFGKIYLPGSKSNMLSCIVCPAEDCSPPSAYGSTVLDGGVVDHMRTAKKLFVHKFLMNMQIKSIPYLIISLHQEWM